MTKEFKKACDLAIKYVNHPTFDNERKLDEYARENNICLCYGEDGVLVEDDMFYFPED